MDSQKEEADKEVENIIRNVIKTDTFPEHEWDIPVINQPRYHKASISIWKDLKYSEVELLMTSKSTDELNKNLEKILNLNSCNKRHKALIELFAYTIQYASENCFTIEQTSAFFSIIKQTNDVCCETPFMNMDQCLMFFHQMVYCHSVRRPPFSVDLFSTSQSKKIIEFGMKRYFRHFKVFKYIFTPKISLDINLHYEGMPITPPPEIIPMKREEFMENLYQCPEQIDPKDVEEAEGNLKQMVRTEVSKQLGNLKENMEEKVNELGSKSSSPPAPQPSKKPGAKSAKKGKNKKK